MKKIKLVLLTTILTIGIYSCSDNSDDLKIEDSIVGIWKPNKEIFILENGTEAINDFSECFKTNRFNFKENGSLEYTTYDEDDTGLCSDSKDIYEVVSASWEKLSLGKYKITTTVLIKNSNQTETDILEPEEILFHDNNVMRISNDDDDFYNGEKIEKAYLEYIRLN